MPSQPTWILRIPKIIAQLELLGTPVVDRLTCERLFGVRRRQAINLMQYFEGFRCGSTILVDRRTLIDTLQQLADSSRYDNERCRKQQLANSLDDLHRCSRARQIVLPVPADVEYRTIYDLPKDIVLRPGELIVGFSTAEELFGKLYELARAAVDDFDRISAAVSVSWSGAKVTHLNDHVSGPAPLGEMKGNPVHSVLPA
jgi:hypothetical protein